jgi:hypothetical protein
VLYNRTLDQDVRKTQGIENISQRNLPFLDENKFFGQNENLNTVMRENEENVKSLWPKKMRFIQDSLQEGKKSMKSMPMSSNSNKEGRVVGFYTQKERKSRILKYKRKIANWKKNNKGFGRFIGRSHVARTKVRIFGKFLPSGHEGQSTSKTGFLNGVISDQEAIQRNQLLDYYISIGDIEGIVGIAAL